MIRSKKLYLFIGLALLLAAAAAVLLLTLARPQAAPPSPTLSAPATQPADLGASLPAGPSGRDLQAKYPHLYQLVDELDFGNDAQMKQLYAGMMEIYQNEGAAGLNTFMKDSGLMGKLKLDSVYLDIVFALEQGGEQAAEDLARQRRVLTEKNDLRLVLVLDTEDISVIEPDLAELGAKVARSYKDQVEILIPLEKVLALQGQVERIGRTCTHALSPGGREE